MYGTLVYCTMFGLMVVAASPNLMIAAVVSAAFFSMWNLFAGFILPRPARARGPRGPLVGPPPLLALVRARRGRRWIGRCAGACAPARSAAVEPACFACMYAVRPGPAVLLWLKLCLAQPPALLPPSCCGMAAGVCMLRQPPQPRGPPLTCDARPAAHAGLVGVVQQRQPGRVERVRPGRQPAGRRLHVLRQHVRGPATPRVVKGIPPLPAREPVTHVAAASRRRRGRLRASAATAPFRAAGAGAMRAGSIRRAQGAQSHAG